MQKKEKPIAIYLRLDGEMAQRYLQIRNWMSLENDTEIIRSLINEYWKEHRQEFRPLLEHFNLDENGVQIVDRQLNRIVHVVFKPNRVLCDYDESSDCRHVDFAMELPQVQEILKKKGWKPK